MKKRYVNALLLGMSLCVATPGTAVSASEIPAQESAVEDTSDAELEAIMREAEAAAAGAGIALPADVPSCLLLLLILIQTFGSLNGQITILQRNLDLIFLEAGQINDQLIVVIGLLDIGLHYIMCMSAIQFLLYLILCSVVKERYIIKKVIK